MNAIKQHMAGLAIWTVRLSSMALLLTAGLVFGVWITIQALAVIV